MSVNQRFNEFMEFKKIQPKELGEIFGRTKSSISAIKTGKSLITTKQIILIAEKFNQLNLRWLLTGSGEMLAGYAETKPVIDIVTEPYAACRLCFEKDKRIAELELHRDDLRRELGKMKNAC